MAPHRARNCLPDGRCRGRVWREPDTRVSAPQSERRRSGADRRRYIRLGVEHDPTLHRQSLRTDAFLPFGPGRQGGLRMLDGLATRNAEPLRSEEHTSELQSLMRISYAVFCLKKKKKNKIEEDITEYE